MGAGCGRGDAAQVGGQVFGRPRAWRNEGRAAPWGGSMSACSGLGQGWTELDRANRREEWWAVGRRGSHGLGDVGTQETTKRLDFVLDDVGS